MAITVIAIDLNHSILQYSLSPLDGDFSAIVNPGGSYKSVLDDPIGKEAILNGVHYPATNRFTAHFSTYLYFNYIPKFLQLWYAPIDSIYASITVIKTLMHIGFLVVIALYAQLLLGGKKFFWIFGATLLSPLLIAHGEFGMIAFLDASITYAMFYTLPLLVILYFYLPVLRLFLKKEKTEFSIIVLLTLTFIQFFLVLFGPLGAPVVFLISCCFLFSLILNSIIKNSSFSFKKVTSQILLNTPKTVIFLAFTGVVFSLYSIFLGSFNSENDWCQLSLQQRFSALPKGIQETFFDFSKGGAWLTFLVLFNGVSLLIFDKEWRYKTGFFLGVLLLFIVIYCFLVPFGGCRSYRPNMLRSDVSLPMISFMLVFIIYSTLRIFILSKSWLGFVYFIGYVSISAVFFDKDILPEYTNKQEKEALLFIQNESKKGNTQIVVPIQCPIIAWGKIEIFQHSRLNANFLLKMNVVNRNIRYKNQ